jgi:hypothetical protein
LNRTAAARHTLLRQGLFLPEQTPNSWHYRTPPDHQPGRRLGGAHSRISNPSPRVGGYCGSWILSSIVPTRHPSRWSCSATPARHHQGAAMASTATPSPDAISDSQFHDILARYPACIAEISDAKGGRLIRFWPHAAPTSF